MANSVARAEQIYIDAADRRRLNEILQVGDVDGIVTNAEMVTVYTSRMVGANSPGRPIYDRIMASARFGRCPFCGHRSVSTLDHHLPKTSYSEFTVTPLNLIPACKDCNKAKEWDNPYHPDQVFLHPYFDDVENDRWLQGNVITGPVATLSFSVVVPAHWDLITCNRVRNQFNKLGLDELYRSNAVEEMLNIRFQLTNMWNQGGRDAVRAHLRSNAESRLNNRVNSWQTATYEALSLSDWYCDAGFRMQ
ncbi:HNH endonuclease [Dyadobacter fanqingshengii]|uniref:HNH endonuclease n=1 Tax=Dyadobacter fanqingshengii TaxID=2906443 RepID=A0A9X1PAG1_9BACT|nr:HNH endonuclease signature motif containing protein [Dyadobacter fanqingshengii]MCF0039702.1 HNH endonuclease [Dyadobacter fanqingshengii]USJ38535.1 HNH endonuclease [Dyadobacter fanqingshengii]